MEQITNIDPIVSKYLREETLSPEEQAALDRWISQGEGRSAMLEDLKNDSASKDKLLQLEQTANNRIWDNVVSRVQQDGFWREEPAVPTIPANAPAARRAGWRYAAAASVLLLIAAGAYWGLNHTPSPTPAVAAQPAKPADIAPGGNRATLTLADGSKINLDSSAIGLLASQGNTQVSKLSDGQLAYNKTSSEEKPLSPSFNVLSTPRAGQFSLALPDGTRVWLNNASSIRYPVVFTGATREVELTGEAYFEVAKDAPHPFFVHTIGGPAGPATIEVLGTAFNIMAYNDEQAERATLVDGSIRYIHGNNSALLKPEEQSVLAANGEIKTLPHVNVDEITAWKNGYFHFDHASLETTMRQIARWYDISVEYKGAIPPQQFVGKIQRNMPLSSLLKGLSGDHIHFTLEGRTVIVQP